MHRYGLGGDWRRPALITVLKLVVQPLIVYVIVFHLIALPPVWAATAVLLAACPTGINAYLLGAELSRGRGARLRAVCS